MHTICRKATGHTHLAFLHVFLVTTRMAELVTVV